MKGKHNAGFSLVEVVVAMAILGAIVVPICGSMILAVKINAKTEKVLDARIAVSSAVEVLMAEGYSETLESELESGGVQISATKGNEADPYYNVEVKDNSGIVTVTTSIRAAQPAEEEGGGE